MLRVIKSVAKVDHVIVIILVTAASLLPLELYLGTLTFLVALELQCVLHVLDSRCEIVLYHYLLR